MDTRKVEMKKKERIIKIKRRKSISTIMRIKWKNQIKDQKVPTIIFTNLFLIAQQKFLECFKKKQYKLLLMLYPDNTSSLVCVVYSFTNSWR